MDPARPLHAQAGRAVPPDPPPRTRPALLTSAIRALIIAALVLTGLGATAQPASATWTLTTAQRQAYLHYYAPVIMKRGDENNGKQGRDWLTNYDFDRDANFSNNRVNWRNVNQYVAASTTGPSSYDRWRIRPTLYTALVEYTTGGSKSLVLLYHVYNAADKDGTQIHDWERVEIAVRGVTGTPGAAGESVNHVTVTTHHDHIMRRSYDSGLNFMQTTTGRHVLLWQADESDWDLNSPCQTYGHELRFVTNPYSWIAGQVSSATARAEVNINGKDEKKNVHYVFAPEGSSAAVSTWGAKPVTYTTAASLASGVDNGDTVAWYRAKRLTYELQDLADVFPTHWQNTNWYTHWRSDTSSDVLLESPIVNEAGQAEVSTGQQRFYTKSRDSGSSAGTDDREGIPDKSWFYGAYSAELNADCPSGGDDFGAYEGRGLDSTGRSRGAASGYFNSHNAFWWQHDFFVHSGAMDDAETREAGTWLAGAWYTAANGGFDGRWVQLFDDRPGYEPVAPLGLSISYPPPQCTDTFSVTANATGGLSPYTFTWTNADPVSSPSDPSNTAYVYANVTATVSVRSADGQARSANVTLSPDCGPGEYLP